MNPSFPPLSDGLPALFRRRGGPVLAILLAAVDAEWARLTGAGAAANPRALEMRGLRCGWGRLLDLAGGMERVARPQMLVRLPLRGAGPVEAAAFWLECLFGVRLVRHELRRPADPAAAARSSVTLAGNLPDADTLYRVLRLVWPAHWSFSAEDIVWEKGDVP